MSFPISIILNINIISNDLSLLSRIYIKKKYDATVAQNESVSLFKDELQEWTEHWGPDLWKFKTSGDNQKIISTSFEHLEKCINFQN